ncbi:hypothetical protein QVD17_30253 [Tagetes erecta]|uniref:Uncharacterized protein n=1 Tax=Tagetes erecta TaxID=13708 RepID=A0AAD8K5A7_TARER|nr:hypothetical protein QVD17_30253 [Tagetes erecta]
MACLKETPVLAWATFIYLFFLLVFMVIENTCNVLPEQETFYPNLGFGSIAGSRARKIKKPKNRDQTWKEITLRF